MNILLSEWAKKHFSPAPSASTLREMRKTGQIQPDPVKVGRSWYVDENAKFQPLAPAIPLDASANVERILKSA